ncbi:hypothetical protein SAMN02745181_3140 [Rubritalea squalenifaciens DSM 18772]|uniref:Tetratricopeptide repeat-containing protein n=1 Tax=Rubritalea squalenifaciens DSM 18772 TaxID=1123071 RepID=A0A1M6PBX9_9BACT|nr:hypothetical protein [Rubritalea squalenifaciens]SHK05453.1 hypothetical protein SAMN02745181_3140 [Rubritalea squalenifaciens DSM 18772]
MSNDPVVPKYSWCCDKRSITVSVLALASAVGLVVVGENLLRRNVEVRDLVEERDQLKQELSELSEVNGSRLASLEQSEKELRKKVDDLEVGNQALTELVALKNRDLARIKEPVKTILESMQDVYAMKFEANNPVLRELENLSPRGQEIRDKWELICKELEKDIDFKRESSLLRLRIAQSYMAAGVWEKVDVSKVDWSQAGLVDRKADILARLYYGMALSQIEGGKREQAAASLAKCLEYANQMPADSEGKEYAQAMANMLQAKMQITEQPALALKHYVAAIGHLRKVVVDMPDNVSLRCTFSQACMDGALMTSGGESAGWSEKLRKEAHGHAYLLTQKHPELKLAHEICAENDILVAEQKLRDGETSVVEPLLQRAEKSLQKVGGNSILESSILGVRAFMAWDKGEREKAEQMMEKAVSNMRSYQAKHPEEVEAKYRLASLYWERSSMRNSSPQAIADGRLAAEQLAALINHGAGRREASARRMLAIIFGDIGHMAAEAGKSKEAKQYFSSARDQWSYLSAKWGDCDEYREGKRWCTSRINGL